MPEFEINNIIKTCQNIIELSGWSVPAKYQILSLWTSYCIWWNKAVDTYSYDIKLHQLYNAIKAKLGSEIKNIDELKTYDNFDNYMCQYLV